MNKMAGIKNSSFILYVMLILLSGCATMYAPKNDNITIKTNPEGADVYLGASLLGKTPLTYSFKRETFEQKTLSIRKQGYKNQELFLQRTIEKKALYNLGFIITTFGVTSWGIDAATGALIKYYPDSYLIDLENDNNSSSYKDLNRFQRFRFVVLNLDNLMKDIASGGGEYLRSYYDSRPARVTPDDYQEFVNRVSLQEDLLLSATDPIEFYTGLENI